MANAAFNGYKPNEFIIESLDGKRIDITNSILSIDYFEDILNPAISMIVQVNNSYSIVSNLPIRGGERVEIDITTGSGDFVLNRDDDHLRVYKVSGIDGTRMAENFTLHLTTQEHFKNEVARSYRRYNGKISDSVKDILSNDLVTTKYIDENIEETSNSYSFIGSFRKPFNVLQWLGPKSLSPEAGSSDPEPDGSLQQKASGTSGYFFYENSEGFNFKSIDTLVSGLKGSGSSDTKKYYQYSYGGKIIKANEIANNFEIIDFSFEKNIDMRKSLRLGTFCNYSYLFNPYTYEVTAYKYDLREEIGDKKLTKQTKFSLPEDLSGNPSRVLVRTTDDGIMAKDGGVSTSGRTPVDLAKSFARYNLLFTQALNILIPCNTKLKVGDVIYCEFPEMSAGESKEIDPESSGFYLIRELRHHFSANQNTTSLKLMRDSYGVY
jgi:hypothetical protein|tara:strand:+ start:311 stop:1618 length:1308 start_codon:yes stop_codon:yes gene_type:complete